MLKDSGLDPAKASAQEAVELIMKNPRVLYRPLLTEGKRLVVGFNPEEMEKMLQP